MSVEEMRAAIKKVYPGPGWMHKVSTMSDAQVTAVYLRMKMKGKV